MKLRECNDYSCFNVIYLSFSVYCCSLIGIGNILDPDFSFVKVAAPYAQVISTSLGMSSYVLAIILIVRE